jgi:hypothetical protein
MTKRPRTAIVQIGLRLPEPLRAHLEKAAKERGVSINAEIVTRLEHSRDRAGLLYEVLELAYGPALAPMLAEAQRHDLLRLRVGDKDKIKAAMLRIVDHYFKEKESKS